MVGIDNDAHREASFTSRTTGGSKAATEHKRRLKSRGKYKRGESRTA
jgi:hypothetical protein